jgi:hypothetical protein
MACNVEVGVVAEALCDKFVIYFIFVILNIWDCRVSVICPSFDILKSTTFRQLDQFQSTEENKEATTRVCLLERNNLIRSSMIEVSSF